MHVVFRVDASISMGIGHVMRCLTLAEELKCLAVTTTFITRAQQGHIADRIREQGHDVILLPELKSGFQRCSDDVAHAEWLGVTWEQDAEETISAINNTRPDWLVVDHYALDARWHHFLREHVEQILVIDDLCDRKLDCDLLLDQTYMRQKADYSKWVPKCCRMLIGTRYALLRPEFAQLRSKAIEKRKIFKGINQILVSMGGTDPTNATTIILKELAKVVWTTPPVIDVVLSSQAPHLRDIKQLSDRHPLDVIVSVDVKDMGERMLKADLAIGAGGSSSWERCCLGLPTLMLINAINQNEIGEQLNDAGAVILFGNPSQLKESDIKLAVERLLKIPEWWKTMSNQSLMVTDALGAKRTALDMESPLSKEGYPIRLRQATFDDSGLLYSWQSDPKTRRYSHNPNIPSRNEHDFWMEKRVNKTDAYTEIIQHGNESAGVIRLDPIVEDKGMIYLISIYISPSKYRLGIGQAALYIISQLMPYSELRAEVKEENVASHLLFLKAGFHKRGDGELYVKSPAL